MHFMHADTHTMRVLRWDGLSFFVVDFPVIIARAKPVAISYAFARTVLRIRRLQKTGPPVLTGQPSRLIGGVITPPYKG